MVQTPSLEENVPRLEPTPIYRCKEPGCKAWVREEYLPEDKGCPLCKSQMVRSIKHLPAVAKPKRKSTAKKKQ